MAGELTLRHSFVVTSLPPLYVRRKTRRPYIWSGGTLRNYYKCHHIMETEAASCSEKVYAAVNNIPSFYRSANLRHFFSQFVETSGFDCFHFRHRPEKQSIKTLSTKSSHSCPEASSSDSRTCCCIIRVTGVKFNELVRTYHQRLWRDSKGKSLSTKCLISRLKTSPSPPSNSGSSITEGNSASSTGANKYQTRGDKRRIPPDREEFKEEDLLKLPELRPPTMMPKGNVGTPTMYFMKLIQECRLPPSIIKKLELNFPKSKNKGKYGSVPFDYQTEMAALYDDDDDDDDNDDVTVVEETPADREKEVTVVKYSDSNDQQTVASDTENPEPKSTEKDREPVPDYKEKRRLKKLAKQERRMLMAERIEEKMIEFEKAGSESGDDNDTCEEWERHEAMYDDVTSQERNKDRLFEEDMEVVWEKGGSGLVFYTDAQYWHEKEGDFDEQTTDDLNVDMSIYYEDGAGNPDIRDFVTIRQEQRRRRGTDKTDRFSAGIGKFECHTKGFGRKILEKQGWSDGMGLGSSFKGMADALDSDWKHPRDRKGLGYRGEKLVRYGQSARRKRKAEGEVLISTVYDDPAETDPVEPLLRRNDLGYIKHRNRIN